MADRESKFSGEGETFLTMTEDLWMSEPPSLSTGGGAENTGRSSSSSSLVSSQSSSRLPLDSERLCFLLSDCLLLENQILTTSLRNKYKLFHHLSISFFSKTPFKFRICSQFCNVFLRRSWVLWKCQLKDPSSPGLDLCSPPETSSLSVFPWTRKCPFSLNLSLRLHPDFELCFKLKIYYSTHWSGICF